MSKYCKAHIGDGWNANCMNCTHGEYINSVVRSGNSYQIKPQVLKNHKVSLKTKIFGSKS